MSNIYKTFWLLSSCWAYLPIGNGVTTLHHNPLVGLGEGGGRGERCVEEENGKQESRDWISPKGTDEPRRYHRVFIPQERFYLLTRLPLESQFVFNYVNTPVRSSGLSGSGPDPPTSQRIRRLGWNTLAVNVSANLIFIYCGR